MNPQEPTDRFTIGCHVFLATLCIIAAFVLLYTRRDGGTAFLTLLAPSPLAMLARKKPDAPNPPSQITAVSVQTPDAATGEKDNATAG